MHDSRAGASPLRAGLDSMSHSSAEHLNGTNYGPGNHPARDGACYWHGMADALNLDAEALWNNRGNAVGGLGLGEKIREGKASRNLVEMPTWESV